MSEQGLHPHFDPIGGTAGDMFIAVMLHARPDLTDPGDGGCGGGFAAMRNCATIWRPALCRDSDYVSYWCN